MHTLSVALHELRSQPSDEKFCGPAGSLRAAKPKSVDGPDRPP